MITRRRRSRRRRSWSSKLRRFLIEHRFNATQGAFGLVAVIVGLWLLWPLPPNAKVDHRGRWARSLQAASQNFDGRDEAVRDGLMPVSEVSMGVSAQDQVEALSEPEPSAVASARLAQIARTMPAIGVPDGGPPPVRTAEVVDGPLATVGASADALQNAPASTAMAQVLPRELPVAAAPHELPVPPRELPGQLLPRELPAAVPPHDLPAAMPPRELPEQRVARMPTWLRNAVTPPLIDDRPEIAIMIDDLGLNRHNTAALNALKGPLTLAFLPYATDLDEQTQAARAAGHELMLHVPMEPIGADWPGPDALLSSLSPSEFLSRLRNQLRSFRGFVGVNNHMGSLLTADRPRMDEVMTELKARGLLFVDSRTTSKTLAAIEAQRLGVPHAERDVFLDNEADLDAIRGQLAATERIARRRGVAIAIGHPHDLTIEALRGWLPTLEERGFALVPISTVVARESCTHGLLVADIACGRYLSARNTIQ
jgi:polysaccharide deacetylase 2 family uncharacterized protein YibQ